MKKLSKDIQDLVIKYPDFIFVIGVMDAKFEDPDVLLLGDACPVCFAEHIHGLYIEGEIDHLRVEGKNMETGHDQLSITPVDEKGKKH